MPASAVDLLARYPTQLTAGDAEPGHARSWDFSQDDVFHVSQFQLKIDDKLKVETGAADLGVGHCSDGAVWAVLIPREDGTLTSPAADRGETITHIWFRFHPAQINQLFPPDSVSADGNSALAAPIRAIAGRKMTSSWQSDGKAMIPEPKDLTVFVDTKEGAHRFFVVDTKAETAEYVAAFNRQSSSQKITPTSLPPVVIKTVPESGSMNVRPGECEIKVTFSKEMADHSWSWCTVWDDSTPEGGGGPKYSDDHKTCVMKVKLDPGTTYGWWLNSENYHGFRDAQGHPSVPYLLVFTTKGHAPSFLQKKLTQAQAGNYWAKFDLWEGYAQGKNDIATNPAEADHWLGELVKGAYLAKFEPVNGFNPSTPGEMLSEFDSHTGLQSGRDSLGGASFFRTTKQDGKLIGSFLTSTPDEFKTAIGQDSKFKLISIEKVTPEKFLAHEAAPQESL
jgi:hypothetical protein